MAADHISICKFESAEGDDYEQVVGNLQGLIDGAVRAIEERKYKRDLSMPLACLELEKSSVCT